MKITNDKYSKPTWAFALGGIVVVFGLLVVLGLAVFRTTSLENFSFVPRATDQACYELCADSAKATCEKNRNSCLSNCNNLQGSLKVSCQGGCGSSYNCTNVSPATSCIQQCNTKTTPTGTTKQCGPAPDSETYGCASSGVECVNGVWGCRTTRPASCSGSAPDSEAYGCGNNGVECSNGLWVCKSTTSTGGTGTNNTNNNTNTDTGGTRTGGGGGGGNAANNANTTSTTGCNPSSPAKVWSCYQETGNCSGCIAYNNGGPKPSKVNSGGGAVTVTVKNPDGTAYALSGAVRMSSTSACSSCNSSCKDPVCNPQREKTLSGGVAKWNDSSKGATYNFTLVGTSFKCSAPAGGACTITAGEPISPTPTPGNDQVNQCWGNETGLGGRCYDCNGDQFINILDFACFAKNWMATIN